MLQDRNTLWGWLDTWLETYSKQSGGVGNYQSYRCIIKKAKMIQPNMPLAEITQCDLQLCINTLCELGYSKSTCRKAKTIFSLSMAAAKENHLIQEVPSTGLFIPKGAPTKHVRAMTKQEQMVFEEACWGDIYGDVFLVLLYTGLRFSELQNLCWKDYDQINKVIHIRNSKTINGIRNISTIPLVATLIESQPKINQYIFNSRRTKEQLTISTLRNVYMRLRRTTGISHITIHVMRHTFATRFLESTHDAEALSRILGHAKYWFTVQQYVTLDQTHLDQQMEKMAVLVSPQMLMRQKGKRT